LYLYTIEDTTCFESLSVHEKDWNTQPHAQGLYCNTCHIPGYLLNQGTYRVRILFLNERLVTLFDFQDALFFSIEDSSQRNLPWYGKFHGIIHPPLTWETARIEV
jgi:lipopolysaccharide transport system ATP-binding protein